MTTHLDQRIRERSGEEPDGGRWWVAERLPAAALRGHLQGYSDYLEAQPAPFWRRHEPHGFVTLILNFAEPLCVQMPSAGAEVSAPAFVAGLHHSWAQTASAGHSRGLQVNLSPLAAAACFGVRMSALSGEVVDLRDVVGESGRVLLERLEAAPDAASRFDLLDATFERALARGEGPPPLVREAYRRIAHSHGAIGITSLADDLGTTRQALHVLFGEYVGLPPKVLARVFRFQRAARRAGQEPWTVIAAEGGYYDQSHLIRDFRQFAGMTPQEFAARRVGNGGIRG